MRRLLFVLATLFSIHGFGAGFVRDAITVSELITFNPSGLNKVVQVGGLTAENDSQGGWWKWFSGDTTETNTTTVFASLFPNAPAGRWKKLSLFGASAPPDTGGFITNYTAITVPTIADLKNVSVTNGIQLVTVEGFANRLDGGGGDFVYDATATEPDDGGVIHAPNNGTGKWRRIVDPLGGVRVPWWSGMVTNGTVNAAIAYASAHDNSGTVIVPGGLHQIDAVTGITMKSNIRLVGDAGASFAVAANPTTNYSILNFTASSTNMTIANLDFQGWPNAPGDAANFGRAFTVSGVTNLTWFGCSFTNFWSDSAVQMGTNDFANINPIDRNGVPDSLLAFGGDYQGVANSTGAAREALRNTGRPLVLPPGTFRISGLVVTNKHVVKGSGISTTTLLPYNDSAPVIQIGSGIADQFDEYMAVSDFSIGTYPASTWDAPCGIRIVGMLFSSLQNVWIRGGETNGIEFVCTTQTISHSNLKNIWVAFPDYACIYTDDSGATSGNFIHCNWDNVQCHSWSASTSYLALLNGGSFSAVNCHWQAAPSDSSAAAVPHGVRLTKRTGFNFSKFNIDCDNHNDVLWDIAYPITFANGATDAEFFTQTMSGTFEIAGYMNFLTNANWNSYAGNWNGPVNLSGWHAAEAVVAIREGTVFNSIYIGDLNEHTPNKIRTIGSTGGKLGSLRRIYGEGTDRMTIQGVTKIWDRLSIGPTAYANSAYRLECLEGWAVFKNGTNANVLTSIEVRLPGTNGVLSDTNAFYVRVQGNDYASTDANSPSMATLDASGGVTNGLALLTSAPNAPIRFYAGGAGPGSMAFRVQNGNAWFDRTAYFPVDPIVTNAAIQIRSTGNAEMFIDSDTDNTATANSVIYFRQKGTNQFAFVQADNGNFNMLRYDDAGVLQNAPFSISGSSGEITAPAVTVAVATIGTSLTSGLTIYTPSAAQTLLAGDALLANATQLKVAGSGGAVTSTATPTIANAALDGTIIYIRGTSDINTWTIQDEGTLPGSNVQLGAATRTLGRLDTLVLMYESVDTFWAEVSFTNN